MDTGTNFSSISRELAKTIFYGKNQQIILYNGALDTINRLTTRVIQVGSLIVEHVFNVAENLPAPIVLGLDFLELHDIDFASRERWLVLKTKDDEQVELLGHGRSRILAAALMQNERVRQKKQGPPVVDKDYPEPIVGNAPLTAEQADEVDRLLAEHKHCFASRAKPLGNVTCVRHRVRPQGPPFKAHLAPLSPAQLKVQQECIDEMVKLGVARPSSSEWASRPSFAPKQDGSIRFCLNFRRLNQFDKKDNYPLPRAPDLLEGLGKKKFFTSLDAAMGYWQIPVHPDDVKYTAVITQAGLFEFVRMPFGLSNAPATYQRLMDTILAEVIREGFCCVYG